MVFENKLEQYIIFHMLVCLFISNNPDEFLLLLISPIFIYFIKFIINNLVFWYLEISEYIFKYGLLPIIIAYTLKISICNGFFENIFVIIAILIFGVFAWFYNKPITYMK
jgi:hypothetical protein